MPAPDSTLAHYRDQQALTAVTLAAARSQWARLGPGDFDSDWRVIGPRLIAILGTAQRRAAAAGAAYIADAVDELALVVEVLATVITTALVGTASDGRSLATLLYGPVITAREALGAGSGLDEALLSGRNSLDLIIRTQVADAARIASGLAVVARSDLGWVRMLNLPSCSRCVILAGKWFRWNEGFERHPGCDCRHIPATEAIAGDLTLDPRRAIESGKVTGLSVADARAVVRDGADPGQVVNAHRGMYVAAAYGRRLTSTREGTSARGLAARNIARQGSSFTRTPRLMPEEIYRLAGDDRIQAIHLLRRFGYLRTS